MSPAKRNERVGNRERIIEASLELFNRRGTHNVTTNHIAAHLAISPGNLYYHFRNREEIVRALYEPGAAEVRSGLALPESGDITAAQIGAYYRRAIQVVWRYRFFFRDIDELLARDPALAASFRELQRWMVGELREMMQRLIAQGDMRAPEPAEDIDRLANNAFLLWISWIRFLAVSKPRVELRETDVVEGALHNFLTFAAYVKPNFARKVRDVIATSPKRRA